MSGVALLQPAWPLDHLKLSQDFIIIQLISKPKFAALMPPILRKDTAALRNQTDQKAGSKRVLKDVPPSFDVNLDLPPRQRWVEIITYAKPHLASLVPQFDEIISALPSTLSRFARWALPHLLQRLSTREETEEIIGISEAADLPVYLVVAFNTFLDGVMACTSGMCPSQNGLLHFRTLDWHMEGLRRLAVHIRYIRKGDIVAEAITYAGYTGCLTGVRRGLSISLNYRALHNTGAFSMNLHRILVLLGRRPSIATHLRRLLLAEKLPSLEEISHHFQNTTATPSFLYFCDGKSGILLEKSLRGAVRIPVDEEGFLVGTNVDHSMCHLPKEQLHDLAKEKVHLPDFIPVVEESAERANIVKSHWQAREVSNYADLEEVKECLQTYPVVNEETHYSCVMDPTSGTFRWIKWYKKPKQHSPRE